MVARENASRCTLSCIRRIHLHRFPFIDPEKARVGKLLRWLTVSPPRNARDPVELEKFEKKGFRSISFVWQSFFSLFFLSRWLLWNRYFDYSSRNKSYVWYLTFFCKQNVQFWIISCCNSYSIFGGRNFEIEKIENKNIITNITLFEVFFESHDQVLFKNFDIILYILQFIKILHFITYPK